MFWFGHRGVDKRWCECFEFDKLYERGGRGNARRKRHHSQCKVLGEKKKRFGWEVREHPIDTLALWFGKGILAPVGNSMQWRVALVWQPQHNHQWGGDWNESVVVDDQHHQQLHHHNLRRVMCGWKNSYGVNMRQHPSHNQAQLQWGKTWGMWRWRGVGCLPRRSSGGDLRAIKHDQVSHLSQHSIVVKMLEQWLEEMGANMWTWNLASWTYKSNMAWTWGMYMMCVVYIG